MLQCSLIDDGQRLCRAFAGHFLGRIGYTAPRGFEHGPGCGHGFAGNDGGDEGFDDDWVDPRADTVHQLHDSLFMVLFPLPGTGIHNPVVIVGYGDDPGPQRYVHTLEALRVALSVPAFVMVLDQVDDAAEFLHVLQHAAAGDAVALILRHFADAQVGVFVEDAVGYAQQADIVHQGGRAYEADLFGAQSQLGRHSDGIIGHLDGVQVQEIALAVQHFQQETARFPCAVVVIKVQVLGNGKHKNHVQTKVIIFGVCCHHLFAVR